MSLSPKDEALVAMLADASNVEPEPRIGPGMILERGRERIVIYNWTDRDNCLFGVFRRRPFGAYPIRPQDDQHGCDAYIRYLLLSGFRVSRPADPTTQEAKS